METGKHSPLVLATLYIIVATIRIELLECKIFDKKKTKKNRKKKKNKKTVYDFATHWFRTLEMPLMHTGGVDSFGIDQKHQVSLYKKTNYTFFCGDVSVQHIIH